MVWIAKFRKKHVPTLVEKIIVCAGLLLVVCTGKHVCLHRIGGVTISFAVVYPKTYDLRSVPPLSLSLKLFVNHILNLSFSL